MADREEGLAAYPVPLPVSPFTNPDLREKSTLGFRPDPMAQTVRGLPARLMQNADESLTKNIMAYMPKPKESRYGSIRMPRASDDPMNAGAFVMAGPIAVEEALGKFAAKALPAKSLENKLLQMGASKAELETRGVTQYLASQGTRPVHPLEVMKYLDDNPYQLNEVVKTPQQNIKKFNSRIGAYEDTISPGSTKFEQWQTPGGENYREILLQAPQNNKPVFRLIDPSGKVRDGISFETEETAAMAIRNADNFEIGASRGWGIKETLETVPGSKFAGGHWDEPNVVAHMRVNDRTLPSGERALHVEEWQSDWSNASRAHKSGGEFQVLVGREEVGDFPTKQAAEEFVRKHTEQTIKVGGTPQNYNIKEKNKPNPLVDNWQDLMARRTLKEAVDGNYDRLTWTTGQQQADRYDLSKEIQTIQYSRLGDKYKVTVTTKNGDDVMFKEMIPISELPNHFGKETADRMVKNVKGFNINTQQHELSGLDLKVGGEWATKLYDESMVNRFNKIGKRYGVKVEDVPLHNKAKYRFVFNEQPDNPASMREFDTKQQVLLYIKEQFQINDLASMQQAGMSIKKVPPTSSKTQLHSIKVTPEMKESIGASKFHPFADLPGPKPKVAPTPPPIPAATKKIDLHSEAAALDPANPVRYVGKQMGYDMYQQGDPGVGSFIVRPGETVADAFARAKARYQK